MRGPSLAIRSKAASLVKPLLGAVLLLATRGAIADDSTPSAPPDIQDNVVAPAPPATDLNSNSNSSDDSDNDDVGSISVEEVRAFDPYSQWLTGAFGYFRNSGVNGASSSYFAGGGLRYGITIFDRVFADSSSAQDAFVIEAGAFYYQVVNFIKTGDSYTVVPLIGTIRYDLSLSESFTLFFYAGFMENIASYPSGNSNDSDATRAGLALQTPAAGAGFFYRVGPSWDLRVDVGTDTAQLGLVLRF
jgi:hypothetical protein